MTCEYTNEQKAFCVVLILFSDIAPAYEWPNHHHSYIRRRLVSATALVHFYTNDLLRRASLSVCHWPYLNCVALLASSPWTVEFCQLSCGVGQATDWSHRYIFCANSTKQIFHFLLLSFLMWIDDTNSPETRNEIFAIAQCFVPFAHINCALKCQIQRFQSINIHWVQNTVLFVNQDTANVQI